MENSKGKEPEEINIHIQEQENISEEITNQIKDINEEKEPDEINNKQNLISIELNEEIKEEKQEEDEKENKSKTEIKYKNNLNNNLSNNTNEIKNESIEIINDADKFDNDNNSKII